MRSVDGRPPPLRSGQTAIVAVLAISVVTSMLGLGPRRYRVAVRSPQLRPSRCRLRQSGRRSGTGRPSVALNTNPSLAYCSSGTNGSGTCGGIDYAQWNLVPAPRPEPTREYYSFGNPQPTFDPTTKRTNLAVEVVGAANDTVGHQDYLFAQKTSTFTPKNGFLRSLVVQLRVVQLERELFDLYLQLEPQLQHREQQRQLNPGLLRSQRLPLRPGLHQRLGLRQREWRGGEFAVVRQSIPPPPVPSVVTTADPNCLFVDNDNNGDGMNGSDANCSKANSDVALYDSAEQLVRQSGRTAPRATPRWARLPA